MTIEDRVREALHNEAARIDSEDPISPRLGVASSEEGPAMRSRVATATLALLLSTLSVALAWVAFRSSPDAGPGGSGEILGPTLAPAGTSDPREIALVDVPGSPGGIVAAEGRVAVGFQGQDGAPSGVAVISEDGQTIVAQTHLSSPLEELALVGSGLWGVEFTGQEPPYQPALVHLSIESGGVLGRTEDVHGPIIPDGLGHGVWAVVGDPSGNLTGPSNPSLVRIDPGTHSITKQIPLPSFVRDGVWVDGSAWLLDLSGRTIFRVDLANGTTANTITVSESDPASNLVTDGVDLYVTVSEYTGSELLRISTENGKVADTVQIPYGAPVAVASTGVWILQEKGAVAYVDLETRKVTSRLNYGRVPAESALNPSAALDAQTASLWISDAGRTVTGIDLDPAA